MTQQVNPPQDRRKHSFHVWLWVSILEAHLSLGAARMFCDRRALSICQQLCSPTLFLHLFFVCLHVIIWLCVAWRVFSGNERLWGGAQWLWISGFSVVSFVYLHISLLQASYLTQICHIPHFSDWSASKQERRIKVYASQQLLRPTPSLISTFNLASISLIGWILQTQVSVLGFVLNASFVVCLDIVVATTYFYLFKSVQ